MADGFDYKKFQGEFKRSRGYGPNKQLPYLPPPVFRELKHVNSRLREEAEQVALTGLWEGGIPAACRAIRQFKVAERKFWTRHLPLHEWLEPTGGNAGDDRLADTCCSDYTAIVMQTLVGDEPIRKSGRVRSATHYRRNYEPQVFGCIICGFGKRNMHIKPARCGKCNHDLGGVSLMTLCDHNGCPACGQCPVRHRGPKSCACGCGATIDSGRRMDCLYFDDACRKRAQRKNRAPNEGVTAMPRQCL